MLHSNLRGGITCFPHPRKGFCRVVILPNRELRPNDAVVGYWWFVVILPNSSPLQQNRCHWEIDGIGRGPDTPDPIPLNASFGQNLRAGRFPMQAAVSDRIRGVLYGQAVGDALGLGTEFLSKTQVRQYYPHGLREFRQIVQDRHRRRWVRGDWTDDTDQMLCILDSLLEHRVVLVTDIAARLHQWAGGGGMGIGNTVAAVLTDPEFLTHPHGAARRVWEETGRRAAANGAVMRTSVLGVWELRSPERIRRNAEDVCRITHYDPRCVASCVVVSQAIAALVAAEPVGPVLAATAQVLESYQPGLRNWLEQVLAQPLEGLDLDEGLNPGEEDRIGYTLKALGAGMWALAHASSFAEGVDWIVHEGGDADTNAAVTGALLGARHGFSAIPPEWVAGLAYEMELRSRVEQLLAISMDPKAEPDAAPDRGGM